MKGICPMIMIHNKPMMMIPTTHQYIPMVYKKGQMSIVKKDFQLQTCNSQKCLFWGANSSTDKF